MIDDKTLPAADLVTSPGHTFKMTVLATIVAATAGFAALSKASPVETRASVAVSNSKSSLTIIYPNNLNVTDDKNHIGTIILDPVPQANAAAACATVNEKLLSKAALQSHQDDFNDALSYQDYAKYDDSEQGYYIQSGVVPVGNRVSYSSTSGSHKSLPVLCTQSANNGSSQAGPFNGSQITVVAADNTFVGYRNQNSFPFLGIPYADTPQRFKYTSTYSKKGQNLQATAYGSDCAQTGSGSEDCLFLNIQTPYIPKAGCKDKLRPMLFWIHGGGFTGGTGRDPLFDGGQLASKEDLVVVTINYRLSTLGFLAIPGTDITGSFGIANQVLAMDWVIANIASFGGEPKNITIAGGSSGAGSVRVHLGPPQAIGKFQGAIAMSNLGGGVTLGLDGDYGTTYSTYYTID